MEKKRLFRIMAKADRKIVMSLAEKIKNQHEVLIVKAPEKALAMVKMREPVKESLFYMGEVIVTEATVSVDGTNGMAVTMGDDFDKTLAMAVIDGACNGGVFEDMETLLKLEKEQIDREEKENSMFHETMVNFHSMDSEAQA